MTLTTSEEFIKSGITGQTFREIKDKFGESFNELVEAKDLMGNFALAFAWFRDHDHLPLPDAYDKAMGLSSEGVKALFEDDSKPEVKAMADFASPPQTTTP